MRAHSILIVDDDPSVAHAVEQVVHMALGPGCEVVISPDGADALDRASARQFDLILTDLRMPRLDGLQLLIRLSSMGIIPKVPAIVLSGTVDDDTANALYDAGARWVMLKPFDAGRLGRLIRDLLAIAPP